LLGQLDRGHRWHFRPRSQSVATCSIPPQVSDQFANDGEARHMIGREVIKKVTSPRTHRYFLGATSKDTAQIVVGGADYYCNVDPRIPVGETKKGTRVLVNEAFVIVGDLGFETAGPVTKITEVIGQDRLRVGSEHGTQIDRCCNARPILQTST